MQFDWEPLTDDETGLREAIRLEEEAGIDIEIGCQTVSVSPIDPLQLRSQLAKVRLFPLLFGALRHLLQQANLGVGLEAALVSGRVIIQKRLQLLASGEVESLAALTTQEPEQGLEVVQSPVNVALFELLEDSDWQNIATVAVAAVQAHLLEHITLCRSA